MTAEAERKKRRVAMLERRHDLETYARSCLNARDWHGLRDAAADLEVIDARLDEQVRHGQ